MSDTPHHRLRTPHGGEESTHREEPGVRTAAAVETPFALTQGEGAIESRLVGSGRRFRHPWLSALHRATRALVAHLTRREWWAYLLVNLALLPFLFDYLNLNGNVYSASQLVLGLSPYGNSSTVIAPLFIQPFDLASYLAYWASGFNPYFGGPILKLLAVAATLLTSAFLYRYLRMRAPAAARPVCLAYLFSPFLLFVNAVWVQPEAFALLFLTLALYLHAKDATDGSGSWTRSLLMGIALLVPAMSFYFPALVVPAFLIYAPSVRITLRRLVSLAVASLPIGLAYFGYGLHSGVTGDLVHSGTVIYPYSSWALFYGAGQFSPAFEYASAAVAALVSVLVPIVFRRRGWGIASAVALVLSIALVAMPAGLDADAFVMAVPFFLLALSEGWPKAVRLRHGFGVQLFLAPIFAIALLLNGPGYVVGIYYWTYPYLFLSGSPLDGFAEAPLILRGLLVVYLVALVLTLVALLRHAPATSRHPPEGGAFPRPARPSTRRPEPALIRGVTVILVSLLALVLLGVAPMGVQSTARAVPPFFFNALDPSTGENFLPAPHNYWYYPSNGTVMFAPSSTPVALERNVTDQSFSLRSSVLIPGFGSHAGDLYPLLGLGDYQAGLTAPLSVNASTTFVAPNTVYNSTGSAPTTGVWTSPFALPSAPIPGFTMGPTSEVVYRLNLSPLADSALLFFGRLAEGAPGQNLLWRATINGTTYESYLQGNAFASGYLVQNIWHLTTVASSVSVGSSFFAGLAVSSTGRMTSVLNNLSIALPGSARGTTSLILGEYNSPSYSFTGVESEVFSVSLAALSPPVYAYLATVSGNVLAEVPANAGSEHSLVVRVMGSGAFTLTIDSPLPTGSLTADSVAIGRLASSTFACYYFDNSLVLGPAEPGLNYFALTLAVTVGYPVALAAALLLPGREATRRNCPRG